MPCSKPLVIDGQTVGCRKCDYCVARRVGGWVYRAMMEKATAPFTFLVALTYNEETEHSRRSARMFDYKDVSDFLKRVRKQASYHLGQSAGALSFIAAGEQGDRYKRCHWHVVLFGQCDFLSLGEWSGPKGPVTDPADIISPRPVGGEPSTVWRRSWSLWPHGFVTVQEPDAGGMRYAMAYALKDQFNVRNTDGTARQGKTEVFGTGYLSMSKKPAIGMRFIDDYLAECAAGGYVPPTRKIMVPGMKYPWWPTGMLRERLLTGLAGVNALIRSETGRDAAGWSTLVYEARESDNDLESLGVFYGQEEQEEDEFQPIGNAYEDSARYIRARILRRRCASSEPCTLCLRGGAASGDATYQTDRDGRFYRLPLDGSVEDAVREFSGRQRDKSRCSPNPLCHLYADPSARAGDYQDVFPETASSAFDKVARYG